jgi:hypothetical protein
MHSLAEPFNMNKLTSAQAYAAMFAFLRGHYLRTQSNDIGSLLGSMSLLPGGTPADAAIADDWADAVNQTIEGRVDLHLTLRP